MDGALPGSSHGRLGLKPVDDAIRFPRSDPLKQLRVLERLPELLEQEGGYQELELSV